MQSHAPSDGAVWLVQFGTLSEAKFNALRPEGHEARHASGQAVAATSTLSYAE